MSQTQNTATEKRTALEASLTAAVRGHLAHGPTPVGPPEPPVDASLVTAKTEQALADAERLLAEAEAEVARARETAELEAAEAHAQQLRDADARAEYLRAVVIPDATRTADAALDWFNQSCTGTADTLDAYVALVGAYAHADASIQALARHEAERTERDKQEWQQRQHRWNSAIAACLSQRHGGTRPGEDDDNVALARVNATIVTEALAAGAAKTFTRSADATDWVETRELGIYNPLNWVQATRFTPHRLDFGALFNAAVAKHASTAAAQAQAELAKQAPTHLAEAASKRDATIATAIRDAARPPDQATTQH